MPYSADQMFALIADVEAYPRFLPWCAAARIRERQTDAQGREVLDADLVISFRVFRERFGSRVTLNRATAQIDVAYLDGPFRYLDNHWQFTPAGPDACDVEFHVDFEFRSRTLQAIVGMVFYEAMQRIVRAFEARAADLYGPSTTRALR